MECITDVMLTHCYVNAAYKRFKEELGGLSNICITLTDLKTRLTEHLKGNLEIWQEKKFTRLLLQYWCFLRI